MHTPTAPATPHAPVRRWRARIGRAIIAVGIVTLMIGATLGVQRAAAILHEVQETGIPGYLSLRQTPADPYWKDLSPGETVHWMIEASLDDAPSSTLALEMRSSGPLADTGRLHVSVSSCTAPFEVSGTLPQCPSHTRIIVPSQPLSHISSASDGTVFPLATLTAAEPRHLLVNLSIPSLGGFSAPGITRIGVGLTATGSVPSPTDPEPSPDPVSAPSPSSPPVLSAPLSLAAPPSLAATGADAPVLILLAVGILFITVGTMSLRRTLPSGGAA